MEPAKRLRQKIARRELTTGILAIHHVWPELVEVCQRAGLDYLIVDMEHGPFSPETVAEICAVGRRADFAVLVRPRANDYTNLRHAIDLGPVGFLLACIESTDDLDVVRDAIYLPPRGRRRPGGLGNRWVADALAPTWKREVEDDFIVLPQVETRCGLENATAIAKHSITTALAAGPYDLSAELGACGKMDDPALKRALEMIQSAARAAGKEPWMIGDGAQLVRDGWRFVCLGEPTWLLEEALRYKIANAAAACRTVS
ncbi:MAG TPA: aldolase/citrate lyase family protein [Gemmataceae bacterium]|nr:aldolase/citrate lyase family protein [Gemmataceae bacterium]